jgi:hypothetical protein
LLRVLATGRQLPGTGGLARDHRLKLAFAFARSTFGATCAHSVRTYFRTRSKPGFREHVIPLLSKMQGRSGSANCKLCTIRMQVPAQRISSGSKGVVWAMKTRWTKKIN